MAITFDPSKSTNFSNGSVANSTGATQGEFIDDPVVVQKKISGSLTLCPPALPFCGGLPIQLAINAPLDSIGKIISSVQATATVTQIDGFSIVSDNMIQSAGTAPTASNGMSVVALANGSGARIPVKCSPAVVAAATASTTPIPTVKWVYPPNDATLVDFGYLMLTTETTPAGWRSLAMATAKLNYATPNGRSMVLSGTPAIAAWASNQNVAVITI